jgi:hypothetical protein
MSLQGANAQHGSQSVESNGIRFNTVGLHCTAQPKNM